MLVASSVRGKLVCLPQWEAAPHLLAMDCSLEPVVEAVPVLVVAHYWLAFAVQEQGLDSLSLDPAVVEGWHKR